MFQIANVKTISVATLQNRIVRFSISNKQLAFLEQKQNKIQFDNALWTCSYMRITVITDKGEISFFPDRDKNESAVFSCP